MVKTLRNLYLGTRRQLLALGDRDIAEFYAQELVCHMTGKHRDQFFTQPDMYVGDDVCNRVEEGLARLLNEEPLAYVLGEWDFYGMTLKVNKDVLIPRDDTCAVVELALEEAQKRTGELRVLDLCTGSGCIGLAIAKNVPSARVTLADISSAALAVAKENVMRQKLSSRVACTIADALSKPPAFLGKFDLIISNPPYITTREMTELPKSVDDYEPHLAVECGVDGLIFYRTIAENYRHFLKDDGVLCFEFGEGQGDDVSRILTENGFTVLNRTKDYNERERAISARYQREDE